MLVPGTFEMATADRIHESFFAVSRTFGFRPYSANAGGARRHEIGDILSMRQPEGVAKLVRGHARKRFIDSVRHRAQRGRVLDKNSPRENECR